MIINYLFISLLELFFFEKNLLNGYPMFFNIFNNFFLFLLLNFLEKQKNNKMKKINFFFLFV